MKNIVASTRIFLYHELKRLFLPRMFIWRSLLQLPENHAAFCSLVDKGTHSTFVTLHENYPIKSRKLLRVLQRLGTFKPRLFEMYDSFKNTALPAVEYCRLCYTVHLKNTRTIHPSLFPTTALLFFKPRILSALAHWSAVFGETEFLPLLVFPFVKLFQNNQLICFEVVATVLGRNLM